MLSVRTKWGDRPGSNRRRGAHNPGCFRLHHGHHEAGTTGLEPATSRLTSECSAQLSYAPEDCAGGIRTHGLELMRLARTAAPLPRKSGWQESNQRSPVPETGGMAKLPYSQMRAFEAQSTTVESNHAYPPYQSGACPAGPSSSCVARESHPAPPGSQPEGSLLALRRSLAGRSRTPVGHGRSVVLIH